MTRRPCRQMTTVLPLGQLRSSGIQAILIDQPMRWWMRWAVSASNQHWARPRSVDHRSPFFLCEPHLGHHPFHSDIPSRPRLCLAHALNVSPQICLFSMLRSSSSPYLARIASPGTGWLTRHLSVGWYLASPAVLPAHFLPPALT